MYLSKAYTCENGNKNHTIDSNILLFGIQLGGALCAFMLPVLTVAP